MLIRVNLSRPWALIRSPIDMEVLRVLRGTTRPLTGREVARLVHAGSQPAVNASLRRLSEEGLVDAEQAGNAYLHVLNREHLAAPAIELLADVRVELQRRLRNEIAGWQIAPTHLSMFGSAARGDGDTRSDIDIFVVRPPESMRTTRAGANNSTSSPSTCTTGPATTRVFPRSQPRMSAGFDATVRRSWTSCGATPSPSPA